MPLSQKILPHYTYKDYVHWEGRWELIEGHPIAMSPQPTLKHQRITASLITEFGIALKKDCRKCKVLDPVDYKISEDTILQPDLSIICKDSNKPFLDFPPSLIAEVLSPSTAIRDRNTKYEIYQQQGVKYYLIADPDDKSIEIYLLINNVYQLQNHSNKFEFNLDEDCSLPIDFNELDWS